jgi:hypothetical protein
LATILSTYHLNLWDTTLRNTYTLRTPLKHFNVNVNVNFNAGIAIFHVLNFSSRTKYSPRDTLPSTNYPSFHERTTSPSNPSYYEPHIHTRENLNLNLILEIPGKTAVDITGQGLKGL